ncbi:MAG: STAS/SEC14 domain-containing protein [Verrucomicrobiales bacterium]|nr:STAS/SEC14 domain-containing protein [Verrucomicrobiales bacterium]
MAVKITHLDDIHPEYLEMKVSQKLHKPDYEHFIPEIEELINHHGKLRILLCLRDFHGWDLEALWQDIKFDLKHFNDIEMLAVVGETKWEKWMVTFCQPFTTAEIRYFDVEEYAQAKDWILTGEVLQPNSGTGLEATPF